MSKAEFNRRMPEEFWREVVDRVAAEAPDTLLLAEAFWLMEGYFVRTLGMHRVYNSAFMNMLRDEQNAEVPPRHQEHARVRPGDPQALRQLHEQPGREDRGRPVRRGRQVLRRRDGDGNACPGCRCSATARSRASPRSTAWSTGARTTTSSPTRPRPRHDARSFRCCTGASCSPRSTTSLSTTSSATAAGSTRMSSPTRTAAAASERWSSTTTSSARRRAGCGGRPLPAALGGGAGRRRRESRFLVLRDWRAGWNT